MAAGHHGLRSTSNRPECKEGAGSAGARSAEQKLNLVDYGT